MTHPLPAWTEDAVHFTDPQHRIWLRRRLTYDYMISGFQPRVVFIGHNPSTAGGADDGLSTDPTATRCEGFARAVGASDWALVNAATGVATDADNLWKVPDPFYFALATIAIAAAWVRQECPGYMIACWGAPKGGKAYDREMMLVQYRKIKELRLPLDVLRTTKLGFPEHPLYLPKTLRPMAWSYKL